MLLGLPASATAHASTEPGRQAPAVSTPVVTTSASHATCDWTPAGDGGAGHPGSPLSPNGTGNVPYAGWAAGAVSPGPASPSGIAPNAVGSWHQVSTVARSKQSIAGDIVGAVQQEHGAGDHNGTGSPCDWTPTYHIGDGHSLTALSSAERGRVVYAAWADVSFGVRVVNGNPDRDFSYRSHGQSNQGHGNHGCGCGIATNYGGHWHQVSTRGLPRQFITGVTVDSFHPAHAYAVYNHGTSQCRCGDGHVFETWNAGQTWTNITGNLPQLVSDVLVLLENGRLALGTNAGVFTAFESRGTHTCWVHLGSGMPRVAVDDLTVGPDNYIYAAAHGHGTWRFRL